MGIQKLFKYYQRETKVYGELVQKKIKELVGEPVGKGFIEAEDLEAAARDILDSLRRIDDYRERNVPVTDEGMIDASDDCTIVKLEIQKDILDCIERKGYHVAAAADGIKLKKK